MNKKDNLSKISFDSVAIANVYTKKNFIYKNDKIDLSSKISFSKSQVIASYINTKDTIISSVFINRSIEDEDLKDVLELKVYEELGLDESEEYIIEHKEIESSTDERQFAIFAVKTSALQLIFGDLKGSVNYIDFIFPFSLLYSILYEREILKSIGIDVFVYFQKDDASMSIYKNGKFLYTKSFDYSLSRIYDKYCQATSTVVDETQFYTALQTSGIIGGNGISGDGLSKIFSEIFMSLNDIVIYTKRAFNIDKIDNIYIGSSFGPIHGSKEYSGTYLGKRSEDLNFAFGVTANDLNMDQLDIMLALNASRKTLDDDSSTNLTIFKRPLPFAQRTGGKFIMAVGVALALALAYPLYFLISSYANDIAIYKYQGETGDLAVEVTKYKSLIASKTAEFNKLTSDSASIMKSYNEKHETLNSIYDKKVNYLMKAKTFSKFAQDLQSKGVSVSEFANIDNNFSLSLVSKDDKKITDLIEYMSSKYFDNIKNIDIKVIEKDQNSSYYNGILKMELK
jgi:hypothetical protein